jgi:hypothetical protein
MPPKTRAASTSSTEIPDGVPLGMWDMLLSIQTNTSATTQRVDVLEKKVEHLDQQDTEDLVNQVINLNKTVAILSAKLERCETKLSHVHDELDDMRAHSMRYNLIFTFDPNSDLYKESSGENCVALTRSFLASVLGIDNAQEMYIPVAHRLGRRFTDKIRPIIANFPIASEQEIIMRRTNRLRDTRHFITKQLTAKQRERKQFVLPVYRDLKVNPENQTKLLDDKLFVKGKLQTKYLAPTLPTAKGTNTSLKLVQGDTVNDLGSTFHGYVASVKSTQDVSDVLDMANNNTTLAAANHLMYAFRIGDDDGNIKTENFHSDGDYGVGLNLLKHMQSQNIVNRMFIVARNCSPGFRHIGNRRMDHAIKVCEKAHSDMPTDE